MKRSRIISLKGRTNNPFTEDECWWSSSVGEKTTGIKGFVIYIIPHPNRKQRNIRVCTSIKCDYGKGGFTITVPQLMVKGIIYNRKIVTEEKLVEIKRWLKKNMKVILEHYRLKTDSYSMIMKLKKL